MCQLISEGFNMLCDEKITTLNYRNNLYHKYMIKLHITYFNVKRRSYYLIMISKSDLFLLLNSRS